MREDRIFLLLILCAIALNRVCSALPSYVFFDPFPLYDILDKDGVNVGISLQSFAFIIAGHLQTILTWVAFRRIAEKFRDIFAKFITLEVVSLADFFIIYEHPWFHIGSYGVEFTDPKIFLYAYYIIRWKH